jgi:uncharacterized protein YecT (DUF1311 family)
MKIRLRLIVLAACLFAASPAAALDCAKARSLVERLVCGRPELKEQDALLSELYARSLKVAQDPEMVASTQEDWVAGLSACNGYECIDEAYEARIERLGAYFNSVQLRDARLVPVGAGGTTCARLVLPQRPDAKGSCQVKDFQPLGKLAGLDRFYALYVTAFRINGSDFVFTTPVVLTANPAFPESLELDLAMLDAPTIGDSEEARARARPKLKTDRKGGHVEFRLAGDREGLRHYRPGEVGAPLLRQR